MSKYLILLAITIVAVAAHPRGHHHKAPCGLPFYTEDLPADVKAKVEAIWKDYKEGDKCYDQQGETREIIDALPKNVRKALYKRPPLPRFLRKAPKDIQDQFTAIFKDKSIPFEDKPAKFKELADKVLTGDLLKQFNEHHEKMEKARADYLAKVEKLSPEAKEAYEKIDKLEKQKREIFHTISDDARDELMELYKERPWGFHHKFHAKH